MGDYFDVYFRVVWRNTSCFNYCITKTRELISRIKTNQKGKNMSKVILNLETSIPQQLVAQGITDFVLDLTNVVGLQQSAMGATKISYKIAETETPSHVYVTNSFEELADALITVNPKFFVATKAVVEINIVATPLGPIFQGTHDDVVSRFLVNADALKGVAKKNGLCEITIKRENDPKISWVILEDFEEIASLVVDGPFDPEMD